MAYILHKLHSAARFNVFTTVSLKIQVFWDMTLCLWVSGSRVSTRTTHPYRTQSHITEHLNCHVELIDKYTLEIT